MNHFEAQSYIIPFIEGKLPENVKEDFVIHMKNCAVCHEELEINYMLLVGMRQLNDEKAISSDFHKDLEQELSRMQQRIHGKQRMRFSAFSICMALIFLVTGFIYMTGLKGVYAYEQDIRKANQGTSYYSNGFHNASFIPPRDRIAEEKEAEDEENDPLKNPTPYERIKQVRFVHEKKMQYRFIPPEPKSDLKNAGESGKKDK